MAEVAGGDDLAQIGLAGLRTERRRRRPSEVWNDTYSVTRAVKLTKT
jgi:hypothetical protein